MITKGWRPNLYSIKSALQDKADFHKSFGFWARLLAILAGCRVVRKAGPRHAGYGKLPGEEISTVQRVADEGLLKGERAEANRGKDLALRDHPQFGPGARQVQQLLTGIAVRQDDVFYPRAMGFCSGYSKLETTELNSEQTLRRAT